MTNTLSHTMEASEIKKVDYYNFLETKDVLGTGFGFLIGFLVVGAILGTTASLVGCGSMVLFYSFYKYGKPLYELRKKNKRIEKVNNKTVHIPPDELIEDFLEWEKKDKLNLYDFFEGGKIQSFYYQGVLDNGVIVLSKGRNLDQCHGSDVHPVPPEAFDIFNFENETLNKRKERNKLSRVKRGLNNSKYQEVLEQTKKELDKLEN